MKIIDYAILLIVFIAVIAIIYWQRKQKKNGGHCSSCGGCPYAGKCHSFTKTTIPSKPEKKSLKAKGL